jgi:hypothetical protein
LGFFVRTQEELLRLRICPPLLSSDKPSDRGSTRDKRKKRVYPDALHEWDDFAQGVENFSGSDVNFNDVPNPLLGCLSNVGQSREENDEGGYLRSYVLEPLALMELISFKAHSKENFIAGQPDGVMLAPPPLPGDVAACCEIKSTQNLLLPHAVTDVIEKYRLSLAKQIETKTRSHELSRVCHPIGQLAGYMVDNKVRYGVLTSGTKTYFLFLDGEDLHITSAWFIGQSNYLRAWAYFASQAVSAEKLASSELPQTWHASAPLSTLETKDEALVSMAKPGSDDDDDEPAEGKPRSGKRKSGRDTGGSSRKPKKGRPVRHSGKKDGGRTVSEGNEKDKEDIHLTPPDGEDIEDPGNGLAQRIPFVKFDSLTDIRVLGWGRNGTTFRATWNGKEVAVKQFDLWKNSDGYETEIEAYRRLEQVWGKLVPEPYFLSESWSGNVRYLGMQLGRPTSDSSLTDEKIDKDYHDALQRLSESYGFDQLDWSHSENCVVVGDNGEERLLVIDLEDVEFNEPGLESYIAPDE